MKPARRRPQHRETRLIEPYGSDHQPRDHIASSPAVHSASSLPYVDSYAFLRTRTRTSHSWPARQRSPSTRLRAISLNRRFNRFLATIPCPSFGTIQPTLGRPPDSSTWTSSRRVRLRVPRVSTSLISRVRRMRADRGSRSPPGKSPAVTSASPPTRGPGGRPTDCSRYRAFLEPMRTVRDQRPRRRRRLRVARPALVFMRARKPCLFKRLRFLGL